MTEVPWVILHLPHASRCVPADVRADFVLDDAGLDAELDRLTDHDTDDLFRVPALDAAVVRFSVSRLVVDPERFEDDANEPMAARGMGAVYTRTIDGRPLRPEPSPERREALLDRYYRPHHLAIEALVEAALERHQRALIIDAHSFPAEPLASDLNQEPNRPDICIGTDPEHTPAALSNSVRERCAELGWSVALDRPYAGTLVPARYYGVDRRVSSIMIEVNRRLYLTDEPNDLSRSAAFPRTAERARELVRCAVAASTDAS